MLKRTILMLCIVSMVIGVLAPLAWAELDYDELYRETERKWTHTERSRGGTFSVSALYWSEEVAQAWVAKYGAENLLSADEQIAYHRDFIQRERLHRYLVFDVTIRKVGTGAPLLPVQFGNNTYLEDDRGRRLYPAEWPYDFDERIHDQASGKVYFSRFDEDGEPFIGPDTKSITLRFFRLSIDPRHVSEEVRLTWNDPYLPPEYDQPGWRPVLEEEIIRLEERVIRLQTERDRLEEVMRSIEREIEEVGRTIREMKEQL